MDVASIMDATPAVWIDPTAYKEEPVMVNPDDTNQEAELEWQQLASDDNITYYGADRNDEWWNDIEDPDEYPDE